MKTSVFYLLCLICLFGTIQGADTSGKSGFMHSWLIFFEGFFIRYIWLPITWYGFYTWLPSILCGMNLHTYLIDALGSVEGIDAAQMKKDLESGTD